MKRIIGLGNAIVDVMTLLESDNLLKELNLPKGSMQMVDEETSAKVKEATNGLKTTLAAGGSAANTIHGLGVLGVDSAFIGSVGDDELGRFFREKMKEGRVEPLLKTGTLPSGNAVALISPDSERTFATFLGASTQLMEEDITAAMFEGYDILYIEGYMIYSLPVMEKACMLASKSGLKIAVDLASYNVVEHMKGDFERIVKEWVDIIFANEDEARAFTGMEAIDAAEALGKVCDIAVVKTGSKGSVIVSGEEKITVGPRVSKPVDTTGAGDLYAAGFIFGLASGEPLDFCGAAGSLVAGNVIEVVGPKMEEERWRLIIEELKSMK